MLCLSAYLLAHIVCFFYRFSFTRAPLNQCYNCSCMPTVVWFQKKKNYRKIVTLQHCCIEHTSSYKAGTAVEGRQLKTNHHERAKENIEEVLYLQKKCNYSFGATPPPRNNSTFFFFSGGFRDSFCFVENLISFLPLYHPN